MTVPEGHVRFPCFIAEPGVVPGRGHARGIGFTACRSLAADRISRRGRKAFHLLVGTQKDAGMTAPGNNTRFRNESKGSEREPSGTVILLIQN